MSGKLVEGEARSLRSSISIVLILYYCVNLDFGSDSTCKQDFKGLGS